MNIVTKRDQVTSNYFIVFIVTFEPIFKHEEVVSCGRDLSLS